jgi:DNA repair exonuclease SbcCD nuclease subunit
LGDAQWGIVQLQQIIEAHPSIKHVLLLGDLFQEPLQQSRPVIQMRELMQWFRTRQVQVYYVQGQHERAKPPWLSAIHDWPIWINKQVVEIQSVPIYGLDYQYPRDVRQALESVPADARVLATHQVWKDLLSEDSGDAWFNWVPAHIRLILTGDYHRHMTTTDDRKRLVVSPGPFCPQKIDEPAVTGVWLANADMTELNSTPLKPRQKFTVAISDDASLQRFIDSAQVSAWQQPQSGVPAAISKNILRVHYLASIENARSRIEAAVGDSAHIFWQPQNIRPAQETIAEQECIETVIARGMVGCIRDFYGEPPQRRDDAIRLWQALNPVEEIQAIVQECADDTTNASA